MPQDRYGETGSPAHDCTYSTPFISGHARNAPEKIETVSRHLQPPARYLTSRIATWQSCGDAFSSCKARIGLAAKGRALPLELRDVQPAGDTSTIILMPSEILSLAAKASELIDRKPKT
jgi:hypothetical protein